MTRRHQPRRVARVALAGRCAMRGYGGATVVIARLEPRPGCDHSVSTFAQPSNRRPMPPQHRAPEPLLGGASQDRTRRLRSARAGARRKGTRRAGSSAAGGHRAAGSSRGHSRVAAAGAKTPRRSRRWAGQCLSPPEGAESNALPISRAPSAARTGVAKVRGCVPAPGPLGNSVRSQNRRAYRA